VQELEVRTAARVAIVTRERARFDDKLEHCPAGAGRYFRDLVDTQLLLIRNQIERMRSSERRPFVQDGSFVDFEFWCRLLESGIDGEIKRTGVRWLPSVARVCLHIGFCKFFATSKWPGAMCTGAALRTLPMNFNLVRDRARNVH